MKLKFTGLVAATHTPFDAGGGLNLAAIERQAEHLSRTGVGAVFIGGTTGECQSLAVDERLALAQRWSEVVRGSALRLVVHVGSNALADARALAEQAQKLGAAAIAAFSPSYFKPKSLALLVDCCAEIAGAAPQTPFYFYDIPSMTGVQFPMGEFLRAAPSKIANLAGVKFTNADLMAYQQCLRAGDEQFDVLWGTDEYLLAALALGARGAVGSTYNFAAPLYRRMWAAFDRGDLATARVEQYRSVELVALLASFGFMAAAKAVMDMLGIEVGPARLPHGNLDQRQRSELRRALESLGFFQWIAPTPSDG
jgi:N-acetylneuraminate lyase